MKKKIHILIVLNIISLALISQNGTRPDNSKVILGSEVVRTIDVIANDDLVAGKNYQLEAVWHSITSPASDIDINIVSGKATYKALHSGLKTDTFFYSAKDLNSSTLDTNYVVVTKDDLNLDLYPGDANKDNICNNVDILNIGIAYGKSEIEREGIYLTDIWAPVRAYDWSTTSMKSNYRFADANGDGTIDSAGDITTILKNYNKTISFVNVDYSPTGGEEFSINTSDTVEVESNDSKFQVHISLGKTNARIANAYGIAFTLKYDPNHFKADKIDFKPSNWFTDQEATLNFHRVNGATGELDITIVRRSGKNGSGQGDLGVVDIIVDDILGGIADYIQTDFEIIKPVLIDSNYNVLPVTLPSTKQVHIVKKSSSSIKKPHSTDGLSFNIRNRTLSLYNELNKTQSIRLINILGKTMMERNLTGQQQTNIDMSHWTPGIYFLRSEDSVNKLIIK